MLPARGSVVAMLLSFRTEHKAVPLAGCPHWASTQVRPEMVVSQDQRGIMEITLGHLNCDPHTPAIYARFPLGTSFS